MNFKRTEFGWFNILELQTQFAHANAYQIKLETFQQFSSLTTKTENQKLKTNTHNANDDDGDDEYDDDKEKEVE